MEKVNRLLKIIEYAEKNGFDFCSWIWKNTTIPLYGMVEENVKELIRTNYYKLLLLDKEFAKCCWGEKTWTCAGCNKKINKEEMKFGECKYCKCAATWHYMYENYGWQDYMQRLVLENNLISYYTKFLNFSLCDKCLRADRDCPIEPVAPVANCNQFLEDK
jgi:hypothetical protein